MSMLAATGLAVLATAALAQTPPAPPAFEVASIKPSAPIDPAKIMAGKVHIGMNIDRARVDIGSLSLAELIRIAYKIKPYQLSGPDFMTSTRFDIQAAMPTNASKEQVPEMLQALLADRFKLTTHKVSTEHSIYALVPGKNGPKLKDADPEPADPPPPPATAGSTVIGSGDSQMSIKPNADGKGATVTNKQFGQMKVAMGEGGAMRMEFARMAMPALAEMLTQMTDRPVVDMTGLKGNYQVSLELSMDEMRNVARAAAASAGINMPIGPPPPAASAGPAGADAAATPAGGSIFTAVQNLGLKLDPRKEPVDKIIVDHLEKSPTEN